MSAAASRNLAGIEGGHEGEVNAIMLLGVFLVLSCWGLVIGWGTDRAGPLARSPSFPPSALSRRFWGTAWIVVLAVLSSTVLAAAGAYTTASTRMWHAMAGSGSLPRHPTYRHRAHRARVAAVAAQVVIALAVGRGLGFWPGPRDEFVTLGIVTVLALVYASGNVGVFAFCLGPDRSLLTPLLHTLLPLAATATLGWAAVRFGLVPQAPYGFAPVAVGACLAVGALLLRVVHRTRRERWLHDAARCVDS
jgi:amino acid transporter